ncbi:LOW QUALITY PROTEIN: hypothetical protein HID58_043575, partial [Brassica napus]
RWYRHGSSNGTLFLRIVEAVGVKLTVTCSTTKNRKLFKRHNLPNFPNTRNIGVVSTDPKTELRKLRTKMHGYGMGPGSEWSMDNWPRSQGKPIRGTIELAGEPTGKTVVLGGRAGPCRGRVRRRVDRQHGRARRASWLVSRPSSLASRQATRPCSPGKLTRVTAELAGDSTGNTTNIGVVSKDPKTELRKLRKKMHGWDRNLPRSPGELIHATVVLAVRAGSCHGRGRRRVDRQHGRDRRASWLVSRPSSPARSCSPGELARVTAELAGESTGYTVGLVGRAGSCHGRTRRTIRFGFLQDRNFFSKISLCSKKMSSRKGFSKRNSSLHSSSGDSSANEVIAPEEEFEVEEEAKDAVHITDCGVTQSETTDCLLAYAMVSPPSAHDAVHCNHAQLGRDSHESCASMQQSLVAPSSILQQRLAVLWFEGKLNPREHPCFLSLLSLILHFLSAVCSFMG